VHLYDTQYPYVHIVLKSSPEGEGVNPTQTEAISFRFHSLEIYYYQTKL
jgi:hypothetical protein